MKKERVGPDGGAPGWNMYVFRDGRQAVSGPTLRSELADSIRAVPNTASAFGDGSNQLIEALLRAGELECALADSHHPGEQQLSCITDALASRLVGDPAAPPPLSLLQHLPATVPETLQVSPPEGFAYYALHPVELARLAAEAPSRSNHALIVGIRTIGVTLSAMVAAELRKCGKHVRRVNVRPTGHPYDRSTEFSDDHKRLICQYRNANADFLVVDEGPGMSGSSFLSAADALVAARVARDRITLLCSRQPDPLQLRAREGQVRWLQNRALYAKPNSLLPEGAKLYVGAGLWREHLLPAGAEWHESWIHMERLKFLSPDKRTLFKFEGFGRYGRAVHERVRKLHDCGFGPECATPEYGFGIYPVITGRLLREEDLSPDLLALMARYCAMRAREFRVNTFHSSRAMEQMTKFNYQEDFGESAQSLALANNALQSEKPIIADGRMQPREWLRADDGRVLKLDGAEHGDDHFFPGPTDIAWDLAGAIIEWNMGSHAQEAFLREYRHAGGDDPRQRIEPFLLAYTSFRMGYCKMAAEAVMGSGEEHRLLAAYKRYRGALAKLVHHQHEPARETHAAAPHSGQSSRDKSALGMLDGPSPEPLAA